MDKSNYWVASKKKIPEQFDILRNESKIVKLYYTV